MTEAQIKQHKLAAKKLNLIKNRAFLCVRKNIGKISEYEINEFILSQFKKEGIAIQKKDSVQIIAFDKNTSFVHYFPKSNSSNIIKKNNLVLIDIWAKLDEKDAPYADITWMGYTGRKIPIEIEKTFNLLVGVSAKTVSFIKNNLKKKILPKSVEIENVARIYFKKFGVEKFFLHGLGHSLGITQCHGTYFRFSRKTKSKLKLNIPFTIEPGLYFKNEFGVRNENNYYVNNDYRLVLTTKVQDKIIKM